MMADAWIEYNPVRDFIGEKASVFIRKIRV